MAIEELDLRDAAVELGVHYQTAYKWVRSGKLDAHVVDGRYRLDAERVATFREARQLPQQPQRRPVASVGRHRDLERLRSRLHDFLTDGQETKARRMVAGLVETDGLTVVTEQLVAPVMRQIGSDWEEGRLPISYEHRASAIVERMLGGLHPAPPGRRRGAAVVASLSGDRHTLPTTMAANALREDNWHVHHLGADVPALEIEAFCDSNEVDLVVLTVILPRFSRVAETLAEKLEGKGFRVLVGSRGGSLTALQQQARTPSDQPSQGVEGSHG